MARCLRHAKVFSSVSATFACFDIRLYLLGGDYAIKVEYMEDAIPERRPVWVNMTDPTNAILSLDDYRRTLDGYRDNYEVREVLA